MEIRKGHIICELYVLSKPEADMKRDAIVVRTNCVIRNCVGLKPLKPCL